LSNPAKDLSLAVNFSTHQSLVSRPTGVWHPHRYCPKANILRIDSHQTLGNYRTRYLYQQCIKTGLNAPPTCPASARWFLQTEDVADQQRKGVFIITRRNYLIGISAAFVSAPVILLSAPIKIPDRGQASVLINPETLKTCGGRDTAGALDLRGASAHDCLGQESLPRLP
jgi:hypothetical protein